MTLPLEYEYDYDQTDTPHVVRSAKKPEDLAINDIKLVGETVRLETGRGRFRALINRGQLEKNVADGLDVTISVEVEGCDEKVHVDGNALLEGHTADDEVDDL